MQEHVNGTIPAALSAHQNVDMWDIDVRGVKPGTNNVILLGSRRIDND